MKSRKPSLILGILSLLVFFVGMFLISQDFANGTYVVYTGMILGVIYWLWSIIEISSTHELKKYQKTFWLILVIAIPMFGAFIYQILHQRRNKIAA